MNFVPAVGNIGTLPHNVRMNRVEYHVGKASARLIGYIHEDFSSVCDTYSRRPAVIVMPGGGYSHLSAREEDPVVFPFFAEGYQVFVLRYSIGEDIPLSSPESEAAEAVAVIRRDAERLRTDGRIAVIGFSAGGHLAASIACHHQLYGAESRVDAAMLAYPVITMGEKTHEGSRSMITHGDPSLLSYYSLETQTGPDTPPCFIWHTVADALVPVENSMMFASSLRRQGIPFEMHLYPEGAHGLSAGRRETGMEEQGVQSWLPLALSWLSRVFSITF